MTAFFSGEVKAFWPHVWLLGGALLGGIAVGIGIILETPESPSRKQRVAMWLVIIGIIIEPICTLLLFAFDEGVSQAQQTAINEARSQTAKAGVTIGILSGTLEGMAGRLSEAERAIRQLQEGGRVPPPIASPPTPSSGTYALTEDAIRIIRDTTKPGAIVSIIPFMPNLERFAVALGAAFAASPGVQVAVGHGNVIMNGQTGLIVQYDHSNPASASVFNALTKAGLNPIEGPPTPGTPITFIKVAPL